MEDKSLKDLMLSGNLALAKDMAGIYSQVDGLSLQNLYYTKYNIFPHCFMFSNSNRGVMNLFESGNFLSFLIENTPEDEEMEHVVYSTYNLDEKKEYLGFCVFLKKSHLIARIEECVSESYILYDSEHKKELYEFIDKLSQFYKQPEEEKNNLWTIAQTSQGFALIKRKTKTVENFDLTKQYNDDFVPEDEKIRKFIETDDKGGLVILHGEKGTGKTTYIRHLINEYPNRRFAFVPSNIVTLLADPAFGTFLQTLTNYVIILEDCEDVIRDRKSGAGSSSAVSLLLNMTDGLLEDDLGLKFICTFNDDVKNIDQALLRKGRLVSKYEFKKLDAKKCNDLLVEIYSEDETVFDIPTTNKPMCLSDIYNYEEDSYIEEKKGIGF